MVCMEGKVAARFYKDLLVWDWLAVQASKLAKEYEKQGGDYENEPGSKNKPKKGNPQPKSESKKKSETEDWIQAWCATL